MKFSRYHNMLMFAFGTVILFLVIKNHVLSFQVERFYTQKFDLNKTETVGILGEVEVLKFSTEEIIIQKNGTSEERFVPHHYYAFEEDGKEYIFTFENLIEEDEVIILDYIVWFYSKPLVYKAKVNIREVELVEVPSKAEKTIHLITDEFGCCLLEGKKLRYNWSKRNPNIDFVGKDRDLFGYLYTHHTQVEGVLMNNFPYENFDATYTLLWLGRSSFSRHINEIVAEIETIAMNVARANPETFVVILTPAPSPAPSLEEKIEKVVAGLKAHEKHKIIDINTFIKSQPNWETRLFYEDYGLNEKAYELILNHLDEQLF